MADHDVSGAVRRTRLFAGLQLHELSAVEQIASMRSFNPGDKVFRIGEAARTLFLVDSGKVALKLPLTIRGESQEVTLEEKEPGAVIAWSSLVAPYKFTLSAEAVAEVCLVGIDRVELESLFEREPRIHLVTMSNMCQVIGDRVSLLEALLIRDLQRWVAEKYQ